MTENILRGISLALGGSPYEFEGKMVGDPFWVMRIIGYPGVNQENDIGWVKTVTFAGLLTLINQDDDKTALQVRNLAGDWISAVPIPGSFICNIGDMLKILSNGVYESTLHRVINNSPRYRVCVAFFYETNFDAEVEPLDIFKEKYPRNERSQVSKRVVYGEHLIIMEGVPWIKDNPTWGMLFLASNDPKRQIVKCDDPDMMEDAGVAEVVRKLDRACRDVGFFYVVKEVTHQFFELPYEEKLKIKITPAAGYRGYQRLGINFTNGKQDLHEAIDCYTEFTQGKYGEIGKVLEGPNQWPENPLEYKELMEEYIKLCIDLSRNILRGISLALGGSPYEFEGKMVGDPFWIMRILGYPGVNQENDIGCGAHTDYGLLSIINQDDDKTALQKGEKLGR
ncbi:unnamed protein product [Thlaspi arvense]|uniref:Fe2OG dioxygenase domain-containing protein n=1 Tax=Thlaspi arvense TaxID=13288 RepID=A0AAU9SIA4_THLAR|nr:unnamed protein product [Thlaspi arvense]